ncbi:ABC transporter permease [Demequina lutea]|uniref:Putative ABC transport system permease protein n=1 Tax=Demequina lutea TaxID=431489 RepID=A0A7Y9ZAS0_9MICO|nr:ABC transporter permease [Demequina lutea]NYI41751.1 putative ABC transport system permease protein [Demequina lutea]
MFLALRSLGFQRGRFVLIGLVISLLALLTVMLSGLSTGLVNDGVSGLKRLPATAFAFAAGTKTDNAFMRSVVDDSQRATWAAQPGISDAELFGVSIVNTHTAGGAALDVTLFGVGPASFLAPEIGSGAKLGPTDGIVLSATARDRGVALGDVITLDRVGTQLRVIGFTTGQDTFGHVDVGYVPLATWQYLSTGRSAAGAPTTADVANAAHDTASAIALRARPGAGWDATRGDAAAGTTTRSLTDSFGASPGYTAETTTITLIQAFLYVIVALVIGAFFTVWTVQRSHELAVLRAVGASSGFLLRDSLIQAAALLLTFTGVGVGAGLFLAAIMPSAVPFAIEASPVAAASAVMVTLGLAGAALAVIRIVRIDPLTALGGQR